MRKLSLILIAAFAVVLAGCNRDKTDSPSIADTSAKQVQPSDDQSSALGDMSSPQAAGNSNDQNATSNDPLSSSNDPTADSLSGYGAGNNSTDQTTPDSSTNNQMSTDQSTTSPVDQSGVAANGQQTPLDETKDSQANVPPLPQDSTNSMSVPSDQTNQ